MSLVVIIDSGIDEKSVDTSKIIGGITIEKSLNNIVTIDGIYDDNLGHGTAIFSIVNDCCPTAKFFIIKIFNDTFECAPFLLNAALGYVYDKLDAQFIIISSGAIAIEDRLQIEEQVNALYQKGTIIISAFNNQGAISYPAAYDLVIGVDVDSAVTKDQNHIIVRGSPIDVIFRERSYRVKWKNNCTIIEKGNSYACAECAGLIIRAYDNVKCTKKEMLLSYIQNGNNKIDFLGIDWQSVLNPLVSQKNKTIRAVVFPFSKEIKAFASNEDLLNIDIVGYYDVRQSGNVGFKVNQVLKYCDNDKIIRDINKLDWEDDFDLVICGHCEKVNSLTGRKWQFDLLDNVRMHQKMLYTFDFFKSNYDKHLCIPIINSFVGNTLGKMWQINAPVIGIFGTSSIQGKFSLQLSLRRKFIKEGYNVSQISTEPTGPFFGMNYTYPIGYNTSVALKGNENALFINEIVHRCDLLNPDVIIAGCQSGTLPHNLFHASYLTFTQYEFLIGLNPDVVILVINYFDELEYIQNTIKFIESSVGAKVIGCVLSPVLYKNNFREFENIEDLSCNIQKPVWEYNHALEKLFNEVIRYLGGI